MKYKNHADNATSLNRTKTMFYPFYCSTTSGVASDDCYDGQGYATLQDTTNHQSFYEISKLKFGDYLIKIITY